jgi:hypothetical protein
VADELVGRLAEQNLALGRGLFQPGGHVDRVAGDQALPEAGVPRDDLAGVDARAIGETRAPDALELVVQRGERSLHSRRRPDGPQRVVLVHRRQAEDGHDRVPDVLFDPAAVLLEHGLHLVEVAREQLAQGLGIERLAEVGGAFEVGEDDRDRLAHFLRRQRRC